MRRRAAPVRWRQYLCRAGSAHSSVEAASIGPSWSAKAAMVRRHYGCAGPNATSSVVAIEQDRAAISCVRPIRVRRAVAALVRKRQRCGLHQSRRGFARTPAKFGRAPMPQQPR
jgi:hypothetical protein